MKVLFVPAPPPSPAVLGGEHKMTYIALCRQVRDTHRGTQVLAKFASVTALCTRRASRGSRNRGEARRLFRRRADPLGCCLQSRTDPSLGETGLIVGVLGSKVDPPEQERQPSLRWHPARQKYSSPCGEASGLADAGC